jgi:hypothetical protein
MNNKTAYYVTMTDKFMSGWGQAQNLTNKYRVACDTYEQAEQIERAAQDRDEMKYINISTNKRSYPSSRYLVTEKHYSDMGGPWIGE